MTWNTENRCFACNRVMGKKEPKLVTCQDEQDVYVGSECFKLIQAAGPLGYLPKASPDSPTLTGPRLFLLEFDPKGPRQN